MLVEPVFEALLAPVFNALAVRFAGRAAHGGDFDGFFRQLLFADRRGRTGAEGHRHPQDAAGGVVDGATAGVVCVAGVSVRLAAEPFGAMAVAAIGHPDGERNGRAHSEEELRLLIGGSQRHAGATRFGRDIVLNALDLRRRVVARGDAAAAGNCRRWTRRRAWRNAWNWRRRRGTRGFRCAKAGNLDKTLGVVHIKDLYAMREQGAHGRGPGGGGAKIDLRAGNGAAGEAAATVSGPQTALRHRGG